VIVQSDGGLVDGVAKFLLQRHLLADELAVFKKCLLGGICNQDAVVTVEQHILTRLKFRAGDLQSHYGRDAK
jgi:hypothetical protein